MKKQTIKIPATGFNGYFRDQVTPFRVSDPDYVKWATERLKKLPEIASQFDSMKKVQHETFAGLPNFQPPSRYPVPMGIGLGPQQALIGNRILPKFVGGPDERGYYPIYGRESFFVDPKGNTVGIGGDVKRLDVKIEFGTVQTEMKAIEVLTEEREKSLAAAVLNIQIDAYKLDVAQKSLALEEEAAIATTVLNTGNYAAGFSETLTSTNQWSHKDSEPVNAVWEARRKVFLKTFQEPDIFAMGGDTMAVLAVNKQIQALSIAARTGQGRTGVPITPDFLAAVFQTEIIVGDAAKIATMDNTVDPSLIWSDFAGLYCTGQNQIVAPRYGVNVTREGYPSLLPYRDDRVGTKGATVYKWADSWYPVVTKNNAGYLWLDTKL